MKELSIEQKAKAYDEAVKEASIAYKDEDRHLKATLERIFPEIAESDDEKIRKEIMQYFWNIYHKDFCPPKPDIETCDKYITWLEKQGKKKNDGKKWIYEDEYIKDLDRLYNDGKSEVLDNPEKFGLQKLVEWSEEDNKRLAELSSILEIGGNFALSGWLKSIKDRVGNFDDGYKVGFSAAKHNQWKPSEEQMKALNAINVTGGISYAGQGQELINLFNDLKKLKKDKL